jgi:hypothetical protein
MTEINLKDAVLVKGIGYEILLDCRNYRRS